MSKERSCQETRVSVKRERERERESERERERERESERERETFIDNQEIGRLPGRRCAWH